MSKIGLFSAGLLAFLVLVEAKALADHMHSPLSIGSGSAAATQLIFDNGGGALNAYVGASAAGALQLSNNGGTNILSIPTITDTVATLTASQTLTNKTLTSPTINSGALSGTFTGSPTFSGGVTLTSPTINSGAISGTFTGSPTLSGTITVGSLSSSGAVNGTASTLSSTGGNVPHACAAFEVSSTGSATPSAGCSVSQVATGGGCSTGCVPSSVFVEESYPILSGANPTGWQCVFNSSCSSGTGNNVFVICCNI